jgi:translation elongation factor P/translation initiation factor 5A
MRQGDVVRFKDVSSFASVGHGSFHQYDGKMGIVIEFTHVPVSRGGSRVKVAMRGSVQTWSPKYFEVINESG